jgi:hypothetical protein
VLISSAHFAPLVQAVKSLSTELRDLLLGLTLSAPDWETHRLAHAAVRFLVDVDRMMIASDG